MKWSIITDSSCDLRSADISEEGIDFTTVPFTIQLGSKEIEDDETADTYLLLTQIENSDSIPHTSCPAPGVWAEAFLKADATIALTISSRLSGSFSSAELARELVTEEHPEKSIAVLDSGSTGPALVLCVSRIKEWILSGLSFDEITAKARADVAAIHTVFALSSFDNLVRNGRMSAIVGFIARKLGMWGIGAAGRSGEICILGKTRGRKAALSCIMKEMIDKEFHGGKVAISHCQNESMAAQLKETILRKWADTKVTILPTRGLNSFYAEREGLIVAYSE